MALGDTNRQRWSTWLSGRKGTVAALLAIGAVVGGIVLVALAIVPDIELVRSETLSGTVPAASRLNVSLAAPLGLIELRLDVGNCTVFVTAVDAAQWNRYNNTGQAPDPQLDCGSRTASFSYPLQELFVENRGLQPEPYSITALLYSVETPRGLWAIPAFPLMIGGSVFLILRWLSRAVERFDAHVRDKVKKR